MTFKYIENPLFVFEKDDVFAQFHLTLASKQPPNQLFHYTTGNSFLKIIKSKCLFATERSYLNDPQEYQWGLKIFRNQLADIKKNNYPPKFIHDINGALEENVMYNIRLFILSLSANPDLLSQWRAYSDDGRGYIIGLNGETLRTRSGFGEQVLYNIDLEQFPKDFVYCYHLLPVIYTKDAQVDLIHDFLNAAYTYWSSFEDISDSASLNLFNMTLVYRIKELLISFKSLAYVEEQEWRIVAAINKNSTKIDYREDRFGITPYVKLNINIREDLPTLGLPLTKIIVGPNSPSKQNVEGIKMLCENMQVPVSFSLIDYRS